MSFIHAQVKCIILLTVIHFSYLSSCNDDDPHPTRPPTTPRPMMPNRKITKETTADAEKINEKQNELLITKSTISSFSEKSTFKFHRSKFIKFSSLSTPTLHSDDTATTPQPLTADADDVTINNTKADNASNYTEVPSGPSNKTHKLRSSFEDTKIKEDINTIFEALHITNRLNSSELSENTSKSGQSTNNIVPLLNSTEFLNNYTESALNAKISQLTVLQDAQSLNQLNKVRSKFKDILIEEENSTTLIPLNINKDETLPKEDTLDLNSSKIKSNDTELAVNTSISELSANSETLNLNSTELMSTPAESTLSASIFKVDTFVNDTEASTESIHKSSKHRSKMGNTKTLDEKATTLDPLNLNKDETLTNENIDNLNSTKIKSSDTELTVNTSFSELSANSDAPNFNLTHLLSNSVELPRNASIRQPTIVQVITFENETEVINEGITDSNKLRSKIKDILIEDSNITTVNSLNFYKDETKANEETVRLNSTKIKLNDTEFVNSVSVNISKSELSANSDTLILNSTQLLSNPVKLAPNASIRQPLNLQVDTSENDAKESSEPTHKSGKHRVKFGDPITLDETATILYPLNINRDGLLNNEDTVNSPKIRSNDTELAVNTSISELSANSEILNLNSTESVSNPVESTLNASIRQPLNLQVDTSENDAKESSEPTHKSGKHRVKFGDPINLVETATILYPLNINRDEILTNEDTVNSPKIRSNDTELAVNTSISELSANSETLNLNSTESVSNPVESTLNASIKQPLNLQVDTSENDAKESSEPTHKSGKHRVKFGDPITLDETATILYPLNINRDEILTKEDTFNSPKIRSNDTELAVNTSISELSANSETLNLNSTESVFNPVESPLNASIRQPSILEVDTSENDAKVSTEPIHTSNKHRSKIGNTIIHAEITTLIPLNKNKTLANKDTVNMIATKVKSNGTELEDNISVSELSGNSDILHLNSTELVFNSTELSLNTSVEKSSIPLVSASENNTQATTEPVNKSNKLRSNLKDFIIKDVIVTTLNPLNLNKDEILVNENTVNMNSTKIKSNNTELAVNSSTSELSANSETLQSDFATIAPNPVKLTLNASLRQPSILKVVTSENDTEAFTEPIHKSSNHRSKIGNTNTLDKITSSLNPLNLNKDEISANEDIDNMNSTKIKSSDTELAVNISISELSAYSDAPNFNLTDYLSNPAKLALNTSIRQPSDVPQIDTEAPFKSVSKTHKLRTKFYDIFKDGTNHNTYNLHLNSTKLRFNSSELTANASKSEMSANNVTLILNSTVLRSNSSETTLNASTNEPSMAQFNEELLTIKPNEVTMDMQSKKRKISISSPTQTTVEEPSVLHISVPATFNEEISTFLPTEVTFNTKQANKIKIAEPTTTITDTVTTMDSSLLTAENDITISTESNPSPKRESNIESTTSKVLEIITLTPNQTDIRQSKYCKKTGLSCLNSQTLQDCEYAGSNKPIFTIKCKNQNKRRPFCDLRTDECVSGKLIRISKIKRTKCYKKGRTGDPLDCSKYMECVPDNAKIDTYYEYPVICPPNSFFSQATQTCTYNKTDCKTIMDYCRESNTTFMAYPPARNIYTKCDKTRSSMMKIIRLQKCKGDYTFDEKSGLCQPACSRNGEYLTANEDCHSFYVCAELVNGMFLTRLNTCPIGTGFNPKLKVCDLTYAVCTHIDRLRSRSAPIYAISKDFYNKK